MKPRRRAMCPACGRMVAITTWGVIRDHGWRLLRIDRKAGTKEWSDACQGSREMLAP